MKNLFPILALIVMIGLTSCLKGYKCNCKVYSPPNAVAPAIGVNSSTEYKIVSRKSAENKCRNEEDKLKKNAQPPTTVECKIE